MTNQRTKTYLTFTLIIACALLALVALPSLTQPALADLPPRPTPKPTPSAPKPAPTGGLIKLHVQFPEAISYQWQELWTVVQWQDEWGYWRTVEGWQGTLDHVTTDDDGEIVGQAAWWVSRYDLGKGPFRWRVYRSKGGWLLVQSDEFYLPPAAGQRVTVEVSLGP